MKLEKHINYYAVEALILGLGFFAVYLLSSSVFAQTILMVVLLFGYATMGMIHHSLKHDITVKVVLEYILISILVFSLFLFVRSGIL